MTATRSPSGPSVSTSCASATGRSLARAALSSRPVSDQTLLFKSATELADLVRTGEVTARELAELALDAIEDDEQGLNAFTTVDRDGALAAADAIAAGDERPFAGVPTAIKDLSVATAGLRVSSGSALYGDYTPDHDAHVVRRIREAGFVIVGKTAAPELGIVPVTEPRRFGPTRNPWNTEHTPGGSSGGSGAAVAGGLVPIAHGSDGGGSIRIPAACCGLVGLKVSRGRISRGPDQGESFLSVDGVLSRTVRDTAVALDVLAGYEPGDANWAPPPFEPFTDLWCAMVSVGVVFGELVSGRSATDGDVEPLTQWLHERALGTSSSTYLRSLTMLQRVARGWVEWASQWDVMLTPALAKRPLLVGELDTSAPDPRATFESSSQFTPFTPFVNVTGQPAIAVPMFIGDDGLPLAAQLIGAPLSEGLLLSVAAQLEAEQRWFERRPAG